jgi:hypothetical protein
VSNPKFRFPVGIVRSRKTGIKHIFVLMLENGPADRRRLLSSRSFSAGFYETGGWGRSSTLN